MTKHGCQWPIDASRAMTQAERCYAQIEKETLGIVFGCTRFNEYIYGRTVIAETDHKPIVAINKKSLCDMTPRIQRLMLTIQQYDFNFEYLPGKHLVVADALSRACPGVQSGVRSVTEAEVATHVDLVVGALPVTGAKWEEIAVATQEDNVLQSVTENILSGWTPQLACHPYDSFQEELTIVDGVILKG